MRDNCMAPPTHVRRGATVYHTGMPAGAQDAPSTAPRFGFRGGGIGRTPATRTARWRGIHELTEAPAVVNE
jgi:hypothetical protein